MALVSRRLGSALWVCLATLVATPAPAAFKVAKVQATCAVKMADLDASLRALPDHPQVTQTERIDVDSGEPIRRNVVDFADGQTFVVEQKACEIANFSVTSMIPAQRPDATAERRLAAILAIWPTWRSAFATIDPAAFVAGELRSKAFQAGVAKHNFSYGSQSLPVTGETAQTTVSYALDDSGISPYASQVTVAITAG